MAALEAIALFAFLFLAYSWFTSQKKSLVIKWPVLGMLSALSFNTSQFHDYSTHVLKLSKYTYEVKVPWFSKMKFIVTCDPENIHYVLSTKSINFTKGPTFKEVFEFLGDGIIAAESESELWKMQKKLFHSQFRRTNFLKLVETAFQQKIQTGLFKILDHASENGQEVDMQDLFLRLTFDVTCRFLLGSDLNSLCLDLPEVPLSKAIDDLGKNLLHRHLKPKRMRRLLSWLQVGLEKKAGNAVKTIESFIHENISSMQERHSKNTANGRTKEISDDLLSNIMMDEVTAKCCHFGKTVDTFLRDQVMNILFAGKDTTAISLSWFLWFVSTNPIVESKIREEIQDTFQMKAEDPWTFPSYSKLNELTYLHATLCETLRLCPPVPFNHRACVKTDIIPSGHHVGKDTEILINVYAMGRMEDLWGKDYGEFRPERWISEKKTIIDMPSFKYIVFGAGPRAWVGKDLAFRGLKSVAAAVIWSYNIRVMKNHLVIPANFIALHMKHGLKVNVAKKGKF